MKDEKFEQAKALVVTQDSWTVRELQEELGVSHSKAHWYMQYLIGAGLLSQNTDSDGRRPTLFSAQ